MLCLESITIGTGFLKAIDSILTQSVVMCYSREIIDSVNNFGLFCPQSLPAIAKDWLKDWLKDWKCSFSRIPQIDAINAISDGEHDYV